MKIKRNSRQKSSWFEKVFGRRAGGRLAAKPSAGFRKLSPSELKRLGFSPKSERYVEMRVKRPTASTPTLSKRQYYQKSLSEAAGRPVTLEQRAREYLTGHRDALTRAQASLRERSMRAWRLRQKYRSERVPRIREHLRNVELKAQGEHLDWDVYLSEKAFAEAHLDVPEERAFYQKWFNYGHVVKSSRRGHDATGRTIR